MDVSLLMTVRDGERFVAEALSSVLEQDTPPAEIIVVDDGSRDATADILHSLGSALSVHHRPPAGIAAGLNLALARSRHDVVAYLDADDLMPPGALRIRSEALQQHPDAAAVGGRLRQFVTHDDTRTDQPDYRFEADPVQGALFGALLFRRSTLDRVGLLDESLPVMAQVDWIARARTLALPFRWLDDVVLHRRIHGRNVSLLRREQAQAAMFEVVRRQRRRNAG